MESDAGICRNYKAGDGERQTLTEEMEVIRDDSSAGGDDDKSDSDADNKILNLRSSPSGREEEAKKVSVRLKSLPT